MAPAAKAALPACFSCAALPASGVASAFGSAETPERLLLHASRYASSSPPSSDSSSLSTSAGCRQHPQAVLMHVEPEREGNVTMLHHVNPSHTSMQGVFPLVCLPGLAHLGSRKRRFREIAMRVCDAQHRGR